jgi:hypothetical protein
MAPAFFGCCDVRSQAQSSIAPGALGSLLNAIDALKRALRLSHSIRNVRCSTVDLTTTSGRSPSLWMQRPWWSEQTC